MKKAIGRWRKEQRPEEGVFEEVEGAGQEEKGDDLVAAGAEEPSHLVLLRLEPGLLIVSGRSSRQHGSRRWNMLLEVTFGHTT